jgi:phage shock protein C
MKHKIYKKLRRSRHERMIAGVCGGLGEYFNYDPAWIRLLFILFLLLGGSAIFVYLVMWLVLPLDYA